ncbi:ShlB/FhaC/HecB family hemolysin secretion/activation protein [Providencia rettgeri]|nr:ShlB/FhaC/HecB family hemolysin secretion/activation protein [Providencia rettgeri]MBX6975068.1 ShlB/FhaC/HecB family hemolysin secretion/activation protein [Providencia rettgeri]MBX6994064.1 ShlB/FhaC/HecB family hemolysin secretion/activation protein [Providencia rettgeri]MBX7022295.1 ShlB/FhaC/HecB family hemolysin secretion/activation protein [Providencia rettgeri]MBX7027757.1 ShlB/FhaC/HecB family hemolysin secretion/activation protein [Providencia rettgeri]
MLIITNYINLIEGFMKNLIFMFGLFISFLSHADYLDVQNKELMRSMKYNEVKEEIENSRENYLLKKKEDEAKGLKLKDENKSDNKVYVKNIDVENLDGLVEVKEILVKYKNKELSNTDIYNLIKELSNKIYEEGYVTSIITLCDKAIVDNTLCLSVKWGRIHSFTENEKESSLRGKATVLSSYPKNRNDIVNIKDIDQAIENSNSSFQSTKIKIMPSENEGYSNIDYSITHRYIPSLNLSMGNGGNGNKNGRFKYDATINYGGLLSFNERYTIGGSARKFEKKNYVENNKFISFGVPFGYYDFSTFYAQSYSKNPLVIANVNFPYESEMKNYNFNLKKKVFRSKYNNSNVKLALNFKETQNYLDSSLLQSSSNNYTDIVTGIDGTFSNEYGTFYIDTSYTQGIGMNNANKSAYNGNKGKYISMVSGNLSYQKVFNANDNIFSFYSSGAYQYVGGSNLISNYKSSIGDEYSIRGLNSSTALSYDSSIYFNNTLNKPMKFNTLNITPFVGFDFGLGRNNEIMSTQYFYSVSSGLKLDYSIVNVSVAYGKLLYLSSDNVYPGVFYIRTSVRI